jgi:selenocysteine-specific elongation factor
LRLDQQIAAVKDDLFIIRSPSPSVTIGGGTVVESHPRRHRRFQGQVLETLAILEQGLPEEIVLEQLQSREPADFATLQKRCALAAEAVQAVVSQLVTEQRVVVIDAAAAGNETPRISPSSVLISAPGWQRLTGQVERILSSYHQENPLRRGMPREELRTRLGLEARLFSRVLGLLLARGEIAEDGPVHVRLPGHTVVLSAEQERRVDALRERLTAAGPAPPSRAELESTLGLSPEVTQALLDRGALIEIAPDVVYLRDSYDALVRDVRRLLAEHGTITVAGYRDHFATSRRHALAFLEHLDQVRVTRRVGDERVPY